jgi:4-methyl-5(b-hydroxyethyl)-thiazole monophosphate biosynthesis
MVYILLADGFEEAEAIVPADLLRRAGVQVALVGVTGAQVTGAHGIAVACDLELPQAKDEPELVMLPGGLGGVENLGASPAAMDLVRRTAQAGRYVAAICAAPSLLGKLGLLKGRKAVCYPGMEETMGADAQKGCSVVTDGKFITGEGPGAAFDFGLKLVETLKGATAVAQVSHDACWHH